MTLEEQIEVMKNELTCIERNTYDNCNRDCANCDLLLPDTKVLETYRIIIDDLTRRLDKKPLPIEALQLDEAIAHCQEAAQRMRAGDPCSSCAAEHEQLGIWLTELKRLRFECESLHQIWYRCVERVHHIRAERDAAIEDLHKLVPIWKWDGEKKAPALPQGDRVEFG